MNSDDTERLQEAFKLVCRKCGSENVVVDIEEGFSYSEQTYQNGMLSFGCNDCKQNDVFFYI